MTSTHPIINYPNLFTFISAIGMIQIFFVVVASGPLDVFLELTRRIELNIQLALDLFAHPCSIDILLFCLLMATFYFITVKLRNFLTKMNNSNKVAKTGNIDGVMDELLGDGRQEGHGSLDVSENGKTSEHRDGEDIDDNDGGEERRFSG